MLENYIDNLKDDIIKETQKLIQIPSVYEDSSNSKMPFGKNANDALMYALELGKSLGFKTKNIDGYCGYIEFGEGKELLGIIGHLDVVPVEDNWTFPPFSGTISDGKIYGRGAIDDKGPVIASLFAMKAVMDNCKLNKRVRLILGINEERDWKCIEHYKKTEELPTISFSPDADFPCIYAEKGILSSYLEQDYNSEGSIVITNIDCNNNAINVVPKYCKVDLKVDTSKIEISELLLFINETIANLKFDISAISLDSSNIQIVSNGISSHAAHPSLGVNAISRMIVLLGKIFDFYNINIELFKLFNTYIHTEYDGKSFGLDFSDESGTLTLNVGDFSFSHNRLKIAMNLRIPVNTKISDVENIIAQSANNYNGIKSYTSKKQEPLYVDKNSYLVTTLCKIFNEMTGRNDHPIAIGGGTYARAFDNCISFGANMPGDIDMCHQSDEFISIDNLILTTKIYAKAIETLGSKDCRDYY